MAHGDSLVLTVEATQRSLEERLREVRGPQEGRRRPREAYAATDAFLAATSRHLAAVESVLLEPVRGCVPDGQAMVRRYCHTARRLEASLSLVKARLYGEVHASSLDWGELWGRVRTDLSEHNRLETELVDGLVRHGDPEQVDGLARKVFDAERNGPTRPHPLLPHLGLLGRVSRRLWGVADHIWDAAEGRVIPAPVRPAPRRHHSLLAQYLVADPQFDDHARVVERRRRTQDSTPV